MADLPRRVIERPIAPDVRDWSKFIMDVLNELDVHVGEKFEIRALERSSRKPILHPDRKDQRAADRAAEAEVEAEVQSQDSLL